MRCQMMRNKFLWEQIHGAALKVGGRCVRSRYAEFFSRIDSIPEHMNYSQEETVDNLLENKKNVLNTAPGAEAPR
jgi:hypothetical protein